MNDLTPEHYDPESTPRWRRLTGLAAWIAVAVGALALDAVRRYLRTSTPRWRTLAHVVAVAVVAGYAYRAADALAGLWTLGPSHADAAAPAGIEAPAVATIEGADPALADGYSAPTATADPRLQPGYVDPAGEAQAPGLYAAPGGPPDFGPPSFLTPGLVPHWPQIDRAAREHGLDPWAWAAVVVVECPLGVNSLPVPSCQYNNGSLAGGLAQITDDTADVIAGQSGYPCRAQKFDPMTSLRCGAFHFRDLLAASGVWRADDELPALQVASIAYNAGAGSSAYRGARAEAQAGRDVCGGIPGGFDSQTHRYCAMMAEMWGVALAERGTAPADAPAAAAPWRDPFGPRVAPGVPLAYLEVGR